MGLDVRSHVSQEAQKRSVLESSQLDDIFNSARDEIENHVNLIRFWLLNNHVQTTISQRRQNTRHGGHTFCQENFGDRALFRQAFMVKGNVPQTNLSRITA